MELAVLEISLLIMILRKQITIITTPENLRATCATYVIAIFTINQLRTSRERTPILRPQKNCCAKQSLLYKESVLDSNYDVF